MYDTPYPSKVKANNKLGQDGTSRDPCGRITRQLLGEIRRDRV